VLNDAVFRIIHHHCKVWEASPGRANHFPYFELPSVGKPGSIVTIVRNVKSDGKAGFLADGLSNLCPPFALRTIDPTLRKGAVFDTSILATHIITGDRRHLLRLGTFQGIPILTAADLLAVATAP
jgi:hypothetical protein